MKTESMSIKDFMSRDFKQERLDKKKKIAKITITVVGTSLIIIGMDTTAFAAESAIDRSARTIYDKLLLIGKWIIIIKGGMDTINNSIQGDFQAAKKSFLSYLIVYLVLHGLPWAFDEVDKMFEELRGNEI